MAPPQGLCTCPKSPAPPPAPLCLERPKGLFPAPPTDHILSAVTMSPELLCLLTSQSGGPPIGLDVGVPVQSLSGNPLGQPSESLVIRPNIARPPLRPHTGDWHTVATPHAQAQVNRLDVEGPL